MVTSLPATLKAVLPAGFFAKSQSGELETLQTLSFGELLKAKERQLQHEQAISAASISAALAAMQLRNLPVSTLPELGTGNGSELRPAAQAVEAAPATLTQPWTPFPVVWAAPGPETLAPGPEMTETPLASLRLEAETRPAPAGLELGPVPAPLAAGAQPGALPAPQPKLSASAPLSLRVETPAAASLLPLDPLVANPGAQAAVESAARPALEAQAVALPTAQTTPQVAVPLPAPASPLKTAREKPAATVRQPATLPTSETIGAEPEIVARPTSGVKPVVAAPIPTPVSAPAATVEKPDPQATVPAATVSQSATLLTSETVGVEPHIVALPTAGVKPVVAAPISAQVSSPAATIENPAPPVTVPAAMVNQSATLPTSDKVGVEPHIAARPTAEVKPVIAAPIFAQVSAPAATVEKPDPQATLPAATVRQPATLPTSETIGVAPHLAARPTAEAKPVIAAPISAQVSVPATPIENPAPQAMLPAATVNPPASLPTSETVGVEPEIVARPTVGVKPVVAAPISAPVSAPATPVENSDPQATLPAATVRQPATLPTSDKVGVEPHIAARPTAEAKPVVAAPVFAQVSGPAATVENSGPPVTVPAATVSPPAGVPTSEKVDVEPHRAVLPASEAKPVVAAPIFAQVSAPAALIEKPGSPVTVSTATVNQPASLPTSETVDVEPQRTTLSASEAKPVVAAPVSAPVSAPAATIENSVPQVTRPTATINPPATLPTSETVGVEPEIVARPIAGAKPVVAAPIFAQVSAPATPVENSGSPVTLPAATVSPPAGVPTAETIGIEPEIAALPTAGVKPVVAAPIFAQVSAPATPVENSGSPVTLPAATVSPPAGVPTAETIGVEPEIAALPTAGVKPVVAAPIFAQVSAPATPVENSDRQVKLPAAMVNPLATLFTSEKVGVEPHIAALPTAGAKSVVAAPVSAQGSAPAAPIENPDPPVTVPAATVSQSATLFTPEKVGVEPEIVARPTAEVKPVVVVPVSAQGSAPAATIENPGAQVTLPSVVSNLSGQARPVDPFTSLGLPGAGVSQAVEPPVPVEVLTAAPLNEVPGRSEPGIPLGRASAAPGFEASPTEGLQDLSESALPAAQTSEADLRPAALPAVSQPVAEPVALKPAGKELTLAASEVIRQIAPELKARIQSGPTSVRLHLNPKELGAIEVHMVSGPQGVSVTFFAEQPGTGRLLETQMLQLRQSMTEAGIQLADLNFGQSGQPRQEGGFFNQTAQFSPTSQPQAAPGEVKLQETLGQNRTLGSWSEVDYLA